jgi:hypothetical protein
MGVYLVLRNRPIIFLRLLGAFEQREHKHAERPDPKEKRGVGMLKSSQQPQKNDWPITKYHGCIFGYTLDITFASKSKPTLGGIQ